MDSVKDASSSGDTGDLGLVWPDREEWDPEGGRTESAVEMYETGFFFDVDADVREAKEDLVLRSLSQPERRR